MSHAVAMSSRARVAVAASARPATTAAAQSSMPLPLFIRRRPAVTPMRRPCPSSSSSPGPGARMPSFYPPRAAGDSAESDPYKFLGVSRNADSAAISRAYNTLKRGPKRFDDAFIAKLEAAHGQIMMQQLSARLSGGGGAAAAVDPSVRFADRGTYFPWRPRRQDADRRTVTVTGAIMAALAAAALFSPTAGTQPVVAAAVVGAVANILKLNELFPPASGPDASPAAKKQGQKNVGRALLLSVMATFAGCFLFYTLPDSLLSAFGKSMPVWFYEGESAVLAIGSALGNWVMTSFYR